MGTDYYEQLKDMQKQIGIAFDKIVAEQEVKIAGLTGTLSKKESMEIKVAIDDNFTKMQNMSKEVSDVHTKLAGFIPDVDEQLHNMLWVNRQKDLRFLEREARLRYHDVAESGKDAMKEIADAAENVKKPFMSSVQEFMQFATMTGVGDIKGNLEEASKSVIEYIRDIRRQLGDVLSYKDIYEGYDKFIRGGGKVSLDDYVKTMESIINETNIGDPKAIIRLTKKIANITDLFRSAGIGKLNFIIRPMMDERYNEKFMDDLTDSLTAVSRFVWEGWKVNEETLFDQSEVMNERFLKLAGGNADKLLGYYKDLYKTVTLAESNFLDAGKMIEEFKGLAEKGGDFTGTISKVAALTGKNILDWQKMIDKGDISKVMEEYIFGVQDKLGDMFKNNRIMFNKIVEEFSLDPTETIKILNISRESYTSEAKALSEALEKDKGKFMESIAEDIHQTVVDRVKNWWARQWPAKQIAAVQTDFDIDMIDVAAATFVIPKVLNAIKSAVGGMKFLPKMISTFSDTITLTSWRFKEFFAKSLPGITSMWTRSMVGMTNLWKVKLLPAFQLVWTKAMALMSGIWTKFTGVFQGVLNAAAAKIAAMGLTPLGAIGIVGGAIGVAAGIYSTVKDIFALSKTKDKEEKTKLKWSIGTKLGAMGIGAAIGTVILPGIGTLVGAGIGGFIAWFKGSEIAQILQKMWPAVSDFFAGSIKFWVDINKNIAELIVTIAKFLWKGVKDIGESVWEGAKDFGAGVGNFFTDLFEPGKDLKTAAVLPYTPNLVMEGNPKIIFPDTNVPNTLFPEKMYETDRPNVEVGVEVHQDEVVSALDVLANRIVEKLDENNKFEREKVRRGRVISDRDDKSEFTSFR